MAGDDEEEHDEVNPYAAPSAETDAPASNADLMASIVPRVTTPRLVLRGFHTDDFESFAEAFADPIAAQFVGGVADRRAAWRMMATGVGLWALTGGGWWAIEMRDTGAIVGTVGAFFREPPSQVLEMGWTVQRAHWGRGVAREAAKAAAAYAFERHGVKQVIAHIDPLNAASIRVSEYLGMRYEGEVDFYGEKTGRYVLARS